MLDFYSFCKEREKIRKKRLRGLPAPWTNDPALQKYRFCNVRRRHDRVSEWLIHNAFIHGNPFDAIVARHINLIESMEHLNFPIKSAKQVMDDLKGYDGKLYNGAYMILCPNTPGNKLYNICKNTLRPLSKYKVIPDSIQANVEALSKYMNIGTFMAGQITIDWTYYLPELMEASDLYTFAAIGPGSTRGLNRFLGRPLTQSFRPVEFNSLLIEVRDNLVEAYPEFSDTILHDIQNCFCEYDKYVRINEDPKRVLRLYR